MCSLESMEKSLKKEHLKWHTENHVSNSSRAFQLYVKNNVKLHVSQIPKGNENLVKFSEIVVYGKWFVTPNLFDELTDRWGVATQTGLRQKNQETITSKYTNPETLGVDAGQEN